MANILRKCRLDDNKNKKSVIRQISAARNKRIIVLGVASLSSTIVSTPLLKVAENATSSTMISPREKENSTSATHDDKKNNLSLT